MASKTTMTRIIRNAYGRRYNLDTYEIAEPSIYGEHLIRDYLSHLSPLVDFLKNKWIHITLTVSIIIFAIGTIYYYNSIMICLQNVDTGASKVEALMQRRNDISINLAKAVLDYSKYERDVMTGIVALRTLVSADDKKGEALKKLAGEPTDKVVVDELQQEAKSVSNLTSEDSILSSLGNLNPLSKLMAVAEQYPDLKLSTTFTSLMTALIEVEKDLATERLKYNDQVNKYTTITAMFPGNFFAYLFNFPEKAYFSSTDDAKALVPIQY
ncbi:MAG: LemA family protein [Desulfamplus sp.]|nr:LemA family protein [Desulfamplus sp.]MBF0388591.1 LemA family protein [Desulfamplus sp.]